MNITEDSNHLKCDIWQANTKGKSTLEYDPDLDVLYIYFVQIQREDRIMTRQVDRNVGLLYRYSDKEIVGMSVDSYARDYLPKYANRVWRLMNTGVYLEGIRDILFTAYNRQNSGAPRQGTAPKSTEQNIILEPIFARSVPASRSPQFAAAAKRSSEHKDKILAG